jgi:hypothetical protein
MPLSCGWNGMNAAFMPYEGQARPGDAVTGVCRRLCGNTGTAAMSVPFKQGRKRVIDGAVVADALFGVPLVYREP